MKLKHLKALCKTLEDYENKCGDDGGNVWGLVINLELED